MVELHNREIIPLLKLVDYLLIQVQSITRGAQWLSGSVIDCEIKGSLVQNRFPCTSCLRLLCIVDFTLK